MKLITPLLRHLVYPLLSSSGYFRRVAGRGGLSVVTYHGVLPEGYRSSDSPLDENLINAQTLRRQLRWLKAKYRVISPEVVLAWLEQGGELEPRSVLLTCDDGLLNNLTDMAPILQEEGLACLFFVTGRSAGEGPFTLWYEELHRMLMSTRTADVSFEKLGIQAKVGPSTRRQALWWHLVCALSRLNVDERDSQIQLARQQLGSSGEDWSSYESAFRRRCCLLTRTQLRQLSANGMTIGAHTETHPVLAQQSAEAAFTEIQASRQALEGVLGTRVWAFAYPFGDFASVTHRDTELAQRAGFACAFLNYGGGFGAKLPRFAIPRIHVSAAMNLTELDAHVSGFYHALRGPRNANLRLSPNASAGVSA
jgi:peptidoglycan/xylan/chitin deacetylase (PgdA/CDA1 family)